MTDRRRAIDDKAKSESVTPLPEDEDEDTPRRSTRAKNPLPPSSGPLFPPLPPKQPRHSRSPRVAAPLPVKVKQEIEREVEREVEAEQAAAATVDIVDSPVQAAEEHQQGQEQQEIPAAADHSEPVERHDEDAAPMDVDEAKPVSAPELEPEAVDTAEAEAGPHIVVEPEPDQQQDEPGPSGSPLSAANLEEAAKDDWEAYRRHRGVRGFGAASSTSSTSERKTRKRRGEEQLLVAEYLAAPEDAGDDDDDRGDVTRCVCGREDIDEMMIQCDKCNVWQHGGCVGIWGDEEAPDEYFCELCKPSLHLALKRYIRDRGRLPFAPPTPTLLLAQHNPTTDYRPSQSNRWPKPQGKRKASSPGTKRKASPSRSMSPAAAKRRSTMNSRDSAYEDAVKAALEASKAEAAAKPKEKEAKEVKKVVVQSEEEEPSGKPKHPNQYTYRPKVVSPVKPKAPAPPQVHEHGTRRNGAREQSANGWNLPDHLAAFADLLPSPSPLPLLVRTPATLPTYGRNHFHNLKYGPFDDETLPLGPPEAPVAGPSWHTEPPVKPRHPVKRVTLAEMKKRVRSVLEYVGRLQSDEARRAERARLLALDGPGPSPPEPPERPSLVAAQLMDELTRELIAFQETFGAGLAPSALANVVGLGIEEVS